ncbi:DUF6168 family protein [Bizionia sp. KMM 8389]
MIKRIIFVLLAVLLLFVSSYFVHESLIQTTLSFSLFQVYLFHAISVAVVYIIVEFVAENLPAQAGYTYLMLMCFKIGAFLLIFKDAIFESDTLTQSERVAIVIPLFIFLTTEAIAVAKLLNSK